MSDVTEQEFIAMLNAHGIDTSTALKVAGEILREYRLTKRKPYTDKPRGGRVW